MGKRVPFLQFTLKWSSSIRSVLGGGRLSLTRALKKGFSFLFLEPFQPFLFSCLAE